MPTRKSAAERLAALREELEFVTTFHKDWEALTLFTLGTFTANAVSYADIDQFERMRAELNRLYPRVSSRIGSPYAIMEQYGRTEQLLAFGFLLEVVPHLGSFFDGSHFRDRFFQAKALAGAVLQQAMGRIEKEIAAIEGGPSVIDSLSEQAEKTKLPAFLPHLEDAESHIESGEFDDAIHSSRRAIERLVTEIANVISKSPKRRSFRAALDTLRDAGLVDDTTHLSIVTQKVGFWGWASEIGTHDEDDPGGGFDAGPPEARLAIERARAIAEYLLSRFVAHVALGENERAEAK